MFEELLQDLAADDGPKPRSVWSQLLSSSDDNFSSLASLSCCLWSKWWWWGNAFPFFSLLFHLNLWLHQFHREYNTSGLLSLFRPHVQLPLLLNSLWAPHVMHYVIQYALWEMQLLTSPPLLLASVSRVTSQFRVSMLGSTQFEVVDLIALCKVCPNSSEVEAYSKSHLKMRPRF